MKRPKAYLNDSGLMAYLLGVEAARPTEISFPTGPLLEGFVAQELRKQIGRSKTKPALFNYRTNVGWEVDFVLEDRRGRIVGVEVKASATLQTGDLAGLEDLADSAGKRFHRGVILYQGRSAVAFAKNLHGLPVESLWQQE